MLGLRRRPHSLLGNRPASPGGPLIQALGSIGRIGVKNDDLELLAGIGYASGDANTFDRNAYGFRFDRPSRRYTDVQSRNGGQHSGGRGKWLDPSYRAAPRGYERITTGGAVENAVYVVRGVYRLTPWASLNAAYLYGQTVAPWTDPFRLPNGGTPTGPRGALDRSSLGHEWTIGAEVTHRALRLGFRGRLWASLYQPGDVYDTPAGDRLHDLVGVWSAGEMQW